jgi:hypothetical protein
MAFSNEPISFTVSVDGEITGEKYRGEFKAKPRLSHRDQMQRDRVRRELLGGDPQFADQRTLYQAEIFSQLSVRIIKAPSWWTDSNGGLDLEDDAVIAQVYKQVMKLEEDAIAALKKEGEEAKDELAKIQEQK